MILIGTPRYDVQYAPQLFDYSLPDTSYRGASPNLRGKVGYAYVVFKFRLVL